MATKWKSSLFIMTICTILFTYGLIGLIVLSSYGTYYAQKDYFHTSEFRYGVVDEYARYLGIVELNNVSLSDAKAAITVTEAEIHEHRYRYGDLPEQIENIKSQYEGLIQQALDKDDQQVANGYIAERDSKILDITKNFESDEHVEAKIVKEKEQSLEEYYKEVESYQLNLDKFRGTFKYYFSNTVNGDVYTNIEGIEEEASLAHLNKNNMLFVTNYTINDDYLKYSINGYEELQETIQESNRRLEGKIGVPISLSSSNQFMIKNETYKMEKITYWSVVSISIVSLLLSFIVFRRAKKSRAQISQWRHIYNKLPIDVRILLFGFSGIATVIATFLLADRIYLLLNHSATFGFSFVIMLVISAGLATTLTQAVFLFALFKDLKDLQEQWSKSLFFRTLLLLKKLVVTFNHRLIEVFLVQATRTQLILLFLFVYVLGVAAVITFIHPIFIFIYIISLGVFGIPIAMNILKEIEYFTRIVEYTKELAAGNLSEDLNASGNSVLATMAANINKLKAGVKISQNEQAKSERLKTELITNVSHDLRTPLTSIVTYTELLKKQQDISGDSAAYLEIIDRKSKRLKILIDDLFEVSKMASGSIELNKEKVDLVQLLQQALAEYDDIINESSLQFRVSHDTPSVHAVVDGQKLWRVFDNLIGNILKYSLENSRVYIHLSAEVGKAKITFKNISNYELNENSNELFERFKRGDTSRNTEGSGLGLAIAQSIVDLHDGKMEIKTDGDLFKVTISLMI